MGRIARHAPEEFEGMRRAGRLAAEVLDYITPHVVPGVSTAALDRLCHAYICAHGAVPAPLNYRGFPKSICTSVNHVVCHGIPAEDKILQEGDILNIDVTTKLEGWHGDTSRMFVVGRKASRLAQRLIEATYQAMMAGIGVVRPGAKTGDIGHAIQRAIEPEKFSIVRDFAGHGVGRVFHAPPTILHYGEPDTGETLQEGMFFTIEPMINVGDWRVRILSDGWTAVTADKKLSAQFEHSLAVTRHGVEIFTESPKGWHKPPYLPAA